MQGVNRERDWRMSLKYRCRFLGFEIGSEIVKYDQVIPQNHCTYKNKTCWICQKAQCKTVRGETLTSASCSVTQSAMILSQGGSGRLLRCLTNVASIKTVRYINMICLSQIQITPTEQETPLTKYYSQISIHPDSQPSISRNCLTNLKSSLISLNGCLRWNYWNFRMKYYCTSS